MTVTTNQVEKFDKDLENVEREVAEVQGFINSTLETMIELEDRSRRLEGINLWFEGIKETGNERVQEKVQALTQEKLGMERVEIDRAHWAGRKD